MDRGWVQPAPALIIAVAVAWLAAFAVERLVRRRRLRSAAPVWSSLEKRCRRPFRITLIIAAILWLLIQLSGVFEDVTVARFDIDSSDNRRARKIRTQVVLFRRTTIAMLVVVAVATAVMTIPSARSARTY